MSNDGISVRVVYQCFKVINSDRKHKYTVCDISFFYILYFILKQKIVQLNFWNEFPHLNVRIVWEVMYYN